LVELVGGFATLECDDVVLGKSRLLADRDVFVPLVCARGEVRDPQLKPR
jgi:hypothetical protein